MIAVSAAARAGTPDEVGTVGALLLGPDGGFITGPEETSVLPDQRRLASAGRRGRTPSTSASTSAG
jgi:hypothetical protein